MMDTGFAFENAMFTVVPIIVTVGFIFVFGIIIVNAIKCAKTYLKNNKSPILTVEAKVATKRVDVSYRANHNNGNSAMNYNTSSTNYFVTFQVESGDRLEFKVMGNEYGVLIEEDKGKLTFQGTRYKGFERR